MSGIQGPDRTLLERLRAGKPCYSLGIRFARNVDFVRMAASAGYDAIWIDLEHSTMSLDLAAQMCAAAGDHGMEAWVRAPEGDFGVVGRILDGGASGIIVPHVVTAKDARMAVDACRYPPRGARSHNALTYASGFRPAPAAERAAGIDARTVVQVLLETVEAVDNAGEIAAVDGVDILALGLNDLSARMGSTGEVEGDAITDCCQKVISAAKGNGKLAIIGGVAGPAHFERLVDLGAAPFVFTAIDTDLFVEALARRIETWRARACLRQTGKDGSSRS